MKKYILLSLYGIILFAFMQNTYGQHQQAYIHKDSLIGIWVPVNGSFDTIKITENKYAIFLETCEMNTYLFYADSASMVLNEGKYVFWGGHSCMVNYLSSDKMYVQTHHVPNIAYRKID